MVTNDPEIRQLVTLLGVLCATIAADYRTVPPPPPSFKRRNIRGGGFREVLGSGRLEASIGGSNVRSVRRRTRLKLHRFEGRQRGAWCFFKKNQNAPRPSEHPPVRGEKCQNV